MFVSNAGAFWARLYNENALACLDSLSLTERPNKLEQCLIFLRNSGAFWKRLERLFRENALAYLASLLLLKRSNKLEHLSQESISNLA
jgi:hypothetical protein